MNRDEIAALKNALCSVGLVLDDYPELSQGELTARGESIRDAREGFELALSIIKKVESRLITEPVKSPLREILGRFIVDGPMREIVGIDDQVNAWVPVVWDEVEQWWRILYASPGDCAFPSPSPQDCLSYRGAHGPLIPRNVRVIPIIQAPKERG